MKEAFEEPLFREFAYIKNGDKNIIKNFDAHMAGKTKISIEEDSFDGVKVILKRDDNDSIKEIKFVCSCGQSKTIVFDYAG